MEQAICDYVKTCSEPDFFHHPDDPALRQVHEDIKRSIEEATETITINMDLRLIFATNSRFKSCNPAYCHIPPYSLKTAKTANAAIV